MKTQRIGFNGVVTRFMAAAAAWVLGAATANAAVAQIGDVTYASINAAFAAVNGQAGESVEIKILADVTEELTGDYIFNKGVTLATDVEGGVTVNLGFEYGRGLWAIAHNGPGKLVIEDDVTITNLGQLFAGLGLGGVVDIEGDVTAFQLWAYYGGVVNIKPTAKVVTGYGDGMVKFRYDSTINVTGNGQDEVQFAAGYFSADYSGAMALNLTNTYVTSAWLRSDATSGSFTLNLDNAKLVLNGEVGGDLNLSANATNTINMTIDSIIIADSISNVDVINIDATGLANSVKVIDYTGSGTMTLAQYATIINVTGGEAYVENNDLWVRDLAPEGAFKVADGFYQNAATYAAATEFYITKKAGLCFFRDLVNSIPVDAFNQYAGGGFTTLSLSQFFSQSIFGGKTVKLLADVDLNNEEWTPIGNSKKFSDGSAVAGGKPTFYGTFDGCGHKVSNLKINNVSYADKDGAGLFGRFASSAMVKNLTIENVDIYAKSYAGALCGNAGSATPAVTIDNVNVVGNIQINGYGYVGGIVGHGLFNVTNCSVIANAGSGKIISRYWQVGGISGTSRSVSSFTDCRVKNIDIEVNYYSAGGVSGNAMGDVTGCTVENLTIGAYNESPNFDASQCGTIVGRLESAGAILYVTDNLPEGAGQCGIYISPDLSVVGWDVVYDDNGKIVGGTFEKCATGALADGYGLVLVKPVTTPAIFTAARVLARVGDLNYLTLAEAIEAAGSGDTVTLLADGLTATLAAGQSVVIDTNGHSGLIITTVADYLVLYNAGTYSSLPNVPATVWVDDNYAAEDCGGHFWGYDAFTNIQQAVDAAIEGGTLNIAAGTYVENVNVDKSLDIVGAGAAATIVDGGADGSVFFVDGDIDVSITGLTIQNGSAADGGGINVQAGGSMNADLAVYDCVFKNNVATTGNGGALANLGLFEAVVLDGCTFSGNTALGGEGGAIYIIDGFLTMANCTVSGNTAKNGGGLAFNAGTAIYFDHVTLTLNTATGSLASKGGGLSIGGASGTIANSIICGNTDLFSGITTDNVNGAMPGGSNNLVDQDAMLAALADNGGPTPTHALLAGSPAVNAGAAGTTTYDQRGVPRDQGNAPDIGAYETVRIVYAAMSPIFKPAGSSEFTLTVTGSGFVPSSQVTWNGAVRSTTYVSGSELRAAIGASDVAAAGTAAVNVSSPTADASDPLTFTITAAAQASEVWVDDGWTGYGVAGGKTWGYDAFGTIQSAINGVATNGVIHVNAGTYTEVASALSKEFDLIGETASDGSPLPLIVGQIAINHPGSDTGWRIENLRFRAGTAGSLLSLKNVNHAAVNNCVFDGAGRFADAPAVNGLAFETATNGNTFPTVTDCVFSNGLYSAITGIASDLTVSNCLIDNVKSGMNMRGSNLVVQDSEIAVKAVTTTDTYGIRYGTSDAATANDLNVSGCVITVDQNGFEPAAGEYHCAVYIRSGATGVHKVSNCSLGGDIVNLATLPVTLDASGNWWGSAVPADVAGHALAGSVDYSPWLADGTDTDGGALGFKGDFSSLWVDAASAHAVAETRMQEAVNLAASGGTVNVLAGTYTGAFTVAKPVTVLGPNATISPNTGTRVAEAVLQGTTASGLSESAALDATGVVLRGLTFDNLRIDNYNSNAHELITDDVIAFNRFVNVLGTPVYLRDGRDAPGQYSTGVVVQDNRIESPAATGTFDFNAGSGVIVMGAEALVIEDNVILSAAYNGIQLARCNGLTLENNTATGCGQPALQIAQWNDGVLGISGNTFSTLSTTKAAVRIYGLTNEYMPEFAFVGNTIKDSRFGVQIGREDGTAVDINTASYAFSGNVFDNIASQRLVVYMASEATQAEQTKMDALFAQVYAPGSTAGLIATTPVRIYAAVPTPVWVDNSYTAGACGGHVWGYDAFTTIQAGVNAVAAGGTVYVASGTYAGVTLTKSVTLKGANAGVAGYAARGAETVILNSQITVGSLTGATVLVIDGFKFAGTGYTMKSGVLPLDAGIVFRNNLVDAKTVGDDAIQIYSANLCGDVSFTANKFADIGLNALVVSSVRSLTVEDNEFTDMAFNAVQLTGAGSINIASNRIDTTYNEAIKLGGPIGGGVCSYNTILNANTSGDGDRGGIRIRGVSLPYVVTIANNIISNSFNGVCVKDGDNLAGATILVTNNSLVDNSNAGIYHGGTGTLSAERNWFGNATGPAYSNNPGGRGDAVKGTGAVDFSPWLGDGTDTQSAVVGFQPAADAGVFYLPASLAFTQPPGGAALGAALNPQPIITVYDEIGQIATQFVGTVTLTIGNNPGSGTLGGTVAKNATAGVVTFTDLSIGTDGGAGYTLLASASPLSIESAVFTINNPPPVLAAMSPIFKPAGSSEFTLTVTGSGFVPSSQVTWNGSVRSTTYLSGSELRATIAASDVAAAGTAAVNVSSPTAASNGALTFKITPSAQASEVWVNDDWTGYGVAGGKTWGYDAFGTIQGAINGVAGGGTIHVNAGTYTEVTSALSKEFDLIGETDSNGEPLPLVIGQITIDHPGSDAGWRIENLRFRAGTAASLLSLKNVNRAAVSNCVFDGAGRFADAPAVNGLAFETAPNGNTFPTVTDCVFSNGLYSAITGIASDLTVSNCLIDNVKSGMNMRGSRMSVLDSEIAVKAVTTTDTYGIRYGTSDAGSANGLNVQGCVISVNQNGFLPAAGEYHCAIYLRKGAIGVQKVSNCALAGDIVNLSATGITLDASGNWWGSAVPADVAGHALAGSVDYSPWLAVDTDTDEGALGFKGDFAALWVDDNSPHAGTVVGIQEGVNLVTAGGTVNVLAGAFPIGVNVTKSVTLKGANAGIAGSGTRGAESVIDGNDAVSPTDIAFKVCQPNLTVVIDGFMMTDCSPLDENFEGTAPHTTDITFRNNLVSSATAIQCANGGNTCWRNVTVADNKFMDIDMEAQSSAIILNGCDLATITDNVFLRMAYNAIQISDVATVVVSRNSIDTTQEQAIQLAGVVASGIVSDNEIVNANGFQKTDKGGIRLYGSQFAGPVNITGNIITGSYNGIAIKDGQDITGKLITISNNNLVGNSNAGIYHGGTGTLNAENNWFGSVTGPANGANAGGTGVAAVGSVDFSPWLGDGADTSADIGFQPNLSPVYYPPLGLKFMVSPVNADLGATLSTVTVQVTNELGAAAAQFTGDVTLAIGSQPGTGVLTGMLTKLCVAGEVSFSDLAVTLDGGTAFTLAASAASPIAGAVSAAFDIANPLPVLGSMSPIFAAAGSGDLTLTLSGSAFVKSSVVKWGVTETFLTPTAVTADSITVTVPAALLATAGTAAVKVFSPAEGGGTSSDLTFTITATALAPEVWVDDDWTGPANCGDHVWGYDAFKTVQSGLDGVVQDGTVNLLEGNYAENASTAKRVKIIGALGVGGQLLATVTGSISISNDGSMTDDTHVENVKFVLSGGHALKLYCVNGSFVKNCVFDGNNQYGSPFNGIEFVRGGSNGNSANLVENCVFGNGLYVGVSSYCSFLTVKNCVIGGFYEGGINLQNGGDLAVENSEISVVARTASGSAYGIRFAPSTGGPVNNMRVTESIIGVDPNDLVPNAGVYHAAVIIRPTAGGTLKLAGNSITGPVVNLAAVALDASGNWWGGNDAAVVSSKVFAGSVDYTPWLDVGTDKDSGAVGFKGDFSTLNVGAASPQAGTVGGIQEGVNLVTAGGTVNVLAGTYAEHVDIDKAVSVQGADKATTFIDGSADDVVVQISASEVAIKGFTVRNSGTNLNQHAGIAAVGTTAALTGLVIEDNIVTNNATGVALLGASATVQNNEIVNNARYGIVMSSSPYNAALLSTGNTVVGNTLRGNARDGIYCDAACSGNLITENWIGGATGTHEVGQLTALEGNGIYLWGSSNNVVSCNEIVGNAVYGIEMMMGDGNIITNNVVTNNSAGICVRYGNSEQPFASNAVHYNDVSGNTAFGIALNFTADFQKNKADYALNAENNWFGHLTGPAHLTNPGGIGAATTDYVDVSPWLGEGTDTDLAAIGFQPTLTPVYYLPVGLYFNTEPTGALLGAELGTQPSVTVTNEIGEVATQFNGSIALAIGNNPGVPVAGELAGTTNLVVVNGVADFTGLSIVKGTGDGYTLVASTLGLPAVTSEAFNIANSTPVLTGVDDWSTDEQSAPSTFTAQADDTEADLVAQTLTFSLACTSEDAMPEGITFDTVTGAFSWQTVESQGGKAYTFKLTVTDNGTGQKSASDTFTVTVNEVNVAPILSIADTTLEVYEQPAQPLTFTATATDQDRVPTQTLTFSLVAVEGANYPTGATLDTTDAGDGTASGAFSWSPTEEQGGMDYAVDVVVTDNGTPAALTATQRVTIAVAEINVAPELAAIPPQSAVFGQTLTFTASATDQDLPAQTLAYTMAGAPDGATLDSSSGAFAWTPTEAQAQSNYAFTVTVTDNGDPAMFDEQVVTIGAITASHEAPGYRSPSSLVVSNSIAFGAGLTSLAWTPALPAGWTVAAVDTLGNGEAAIGEGGVLTFTTLPTNSPAVFTYTVSVPGDQAVSNLLSATVAFNGLTAQVEPLPLFRYHSADYRSDLSGETVGQFRKIDSTEISRVLSYWRFGYKPDADGLDGFSAAADYAGTEAVHHSADTDKNWVVDGNELLRVQMYWRNGGYMVDLATPDGYATDPSRTGTGPSLFTLAGIPAAAQTAPSGYNPGETLQVTYTLDTAGASLLALGWAPELPEGWMIENVSGDAAPMFARNEIICGAAVLPTATATVTVTVRVPLTETRTVTLGGAARLITDSGYAVESYAMESVTLAPVDDDSNGMADAWERAFAGAAGTLDPAADLDGDTMSNLNEYRCGTLPNDAASVLKMVAVRPSADGTMQISWASVAGRTYTVQRADGSPAAANFKAILTGSAADPSGRNVYVDDADGAQARFYRVVLQD